MGTINVFKDSVDGQLVHIVPADIADGETSQYNVYFNLTGYDNTTKVFTVNGRNIDSGIQPPDPTPDPGQPGGGDGGSGGNQGGSGGGSGGGSVPPVPEVPVDDTLIITLLPETPYLNERIIISLSGTEKTIAKPTVNHPNAVITQGDTDKTWYLSFDGTQGNDAPITVEVTFSGNDGVKDATVEVTFTPVGQMVVAGSLSTYLPGTIKLVVSPVEGTIDATTDADNVRITNNNDGTLIIESSEAQAFDLTISQDGFDPVVRHLEFLEVRDMVITNDHDDNSAFINEIMLLDLPEDATNVIITDESGILEIDLVDEEHNVYGITTDVPNRYNISITAKGYREEVIQLQFKELEVPGYSFAIQNPIMSEEQVVTITGVTTDVNVELVGPDKTSPAADMTLGPVKPDAPYEFSITATAATTGYLKVTAPSIETLFIPIVFEEKKVLKSTTVPGTGIVAFDGKITISLTNYYGTISAACDNPNVVISDEGEVEGVYKYNVTFNGSSDTEANIVINGDDVETLTIPVQFKEGILEDIYFETVPGNATTEIGRAIKVKVLGTNREVIASGSDGLSVVKDSDYDYTATALVEGDYDLRFTGEGVRSKSIKLGYREIKQFHTASSSYSISLNDIPYNIKVLDVDDVTPVTCLVNNSNVTATYDVLTNNIEVDLVDAAITEDITCQLTLSYANHQDVVVPVSIIVPEELGKMPCDGTTLRCGKGEKVFITIPMPDKNDVISASCQDSNLTIDYKAGTNRIYLSSNYLGTYTVRVKHTEYQDATVKFIVAEKFVEPVVPEPDKPIYDLGKAPQVNVTVNTEDFISDVFSLPTLKTDKERLAVVIQKGSANIQYIGGQICTYQEKMSKVNATPSITDGAKANYGLYSTLMAALKIDDYYEFREIMKLVVKLFKVYKDDSLSDVSLMRFDRGWVWGDNRLEEYKLLVTFLTKYVKANGQNVKTTGLPFKQEIINKLNRFCAENIQP